MINQKMIDEYNKYNKHIEEKQELSNIDMIDSSLKPVMPPPKNTEHRELIISLCKLFKPKVYVELGVKNGYVFNEVAKYAVIAVGVDVKGFTDQTTRITNATLFHTTTSNFIEIWKGLENTPYKNIDLLFIDACHEKEQVLRDFFGLIPFVTENSGLVMLHDTYPITPNLSSERYCWSAFEAAFYLRKDYSDRYEVLTLPGPIAGITLIRKAIKQVHWL
jgi:predicted O-methyltransferase YrrM